MKKQTQTSSEKLIQRLDLPKEILLGHPNIHLCGNRELVIDNHRGILRLSKEQISIRTKYGVIDVKGKSMEVEYYENDSIKIRGYIFNIGFSK